MLKDEIIAGELEICRQQREQTKYAKKKMREWEMALTRQEKALRALRQAQHLLEAKQEELAPELRGIQISLLNPKTDQEAIDRLNITGSGKKPDVQVLEEIFITYGPMHLHDVVRRGQERGLTFKGRKKPMLVARDKMTASKRFVLFGNNVWGLPNQEYAEAGTKEKNPGN